MKYIIELTTAERKVICNIITAIRNNSLGGHRLFENTTLCKFDEESTDYSLAYRAGIEAGKKQAINELPELKKQEYTKGYNSAINDYNAMYEWLHDCFVDFKKFLLEKGFYTDEKFLDGFVVGQLMYDLICDHDIAEVISEFKKWQEEKKKAEEIKVGDEVKSICGGLVGVVTRVNQSTGRFRILFSDGSGGMTEIFPEDYEKTGRHFEEISQLLDKLRGEDE